MEASLAALLLSLRRRAVDGAGFEKETEIRGGSPGLDPRRAEMYSVSGSSSLVVSCDGSAEAEKDGAR